MAIMQIKIWKQMSSRSVLALILTANTCAIAFEGYGQGVIGIANAAPNYLNTVGISKNNSGMVDKVTTQGGITCIYYFGAIWGCLLSGWISDTFGRVPALQTGAIWCILGIALEASAQSQPWIICARVIAGVGVGHMNAIAPTWVSEISEAVHRGKLFSLVYLSNYIGIALAYWIGFGLSFVDGGQSQIRWRLPFAIDAVPPIILFGLLPFVPESPRFLLSVGKSEEALEVLAHVRANGDLQNGTVQAEYREIHRSVQNGKTHADRNGYLPMLLGRNGGGSNYAHRTQLAILLPLFTQIGTGIAATTIYAPSLIQRAGWGEQKAEWLSALNNTVGILGTVISMLTIDPVGRRTTLLWGSLAQSACMWIIGAMSILTISRPAQASQYGSASVSFIFLFTLIYSSTYLIINLNYPAEIFPTEVRSRGMAFGIIGWAVGLGAGTLYNPVLFNNLGGYGFFIYGGLNLVWFVLVFLFLPETSKRSLETINQLFETSSVLVTHMEGHYQSSLTSSAPTEAGQSKVELESKESI